MMPHILLTDYALFFGRFHPLVVHLPIGFLLLAVLMEFWPGERLRTAIRIAWVLGAASAVAAATFGWLLASDGGYGGDALFWHRWGGVTVAALAVAGIFLTRTGGIGAKAYAVLTAAALTVAGHQGGNLTHGEEYLFQYAPPVVQTLAGHAPDTLVAYDWDAMDTDSINVYTALLKPVIQEKCERCHNEDKQNGGLRMDSTHHLLAGGDGGALFVAGQPTESQWVRRVTLPRTNVKAMPPQGQPMTYTEVRLLHHWIAEGADTMAVLDNETIPDDLKALLLRDYELDLSPKLFVEKLRAPALGAEARQTLTAAGWRLNDLVPGGAALEAKVPPGGSIDAAALDELARLAGPQIAYLNLDRMPFGDRELQALAQFPNLNRLRLNGTRVTAATIDELRALRHLESLNLYGTEVGDDIFAALGDYPALRRLYLWQTAVSPEAVATFQKARPEVDVDTGFSFTTEPSETATK